MATTLDRYMFIEQCIGSILPQVDELHVYCNNYPVIPADLQQPKLFLYDKPAGDLGDKGKFYAHQRNCVNITVDDDLVYGAGFALTMVRGVQRYGGFVSLHGKRILRALNSYLRDTGGQQVYSCLGRVEKDVRVHIPGTGCMAYDGGVIAPIRASSLQFANMADVLVGVMAKHRNWPVHVLAHEAGDVEQLPTARSIFYQSDFFHDQAQTEIVNDNFAPKGDAEHNQ